MKLKKILTIALVVSITVSTMLDPMQATATTVDSVSSATESTDINTDTVTPTATPEPTATPTVTPTPKATKTTYPTSFKDVKSGSTYYTAVSYLAKKGTIGGYKDGSFKATTNITNAKFITILMRAINPKLSRATKGNDYSAAVLKEAAKLGIYKASELTAENYTSSLTRKNMILWTARALDYMGEDVKVIADIENLITDFDSISDSKYQDAAKEVYSAGIVTSKTFSQNSKVTRGTAITVIYKTVYAKARTNMTKVTIPDTPTDIRDGATLNYNDPNRFLPKAGDTWVAKDGKKTKITSISYNNVEVPGYGQGIDLYSGLVYDGTRTFKNGDTGIVWHGDDSFLGSPFIVTKDHNGKVFAYFRIQWKTVQSYEQAQAAKVKSPKDGQYCGYFTQYNKEYDDWIWVGPVF